MKTLNQVSLLFVIMALSAMNVFAQENEAPTPKKFENVTWHIQASIKVDPMKADSVRSFVTDIYLPAAENAGLSVEAYWFATGDWNLMIVMELENGPADLEWEVPPMAPEMIKFMNEKEGGAQYLQMANAAIKEVDSNLVMKLQAE